MTLSDPVPHGSALVECLNLLSQRQFAAAANLIRSSRRIEDERQAITDAALVAAILPASESHLIAEKESTSLQLSADYLIQFCDALLGCGEQDVALALLEKNKAFNPHHIGGRAALARALQGRGDKILAKHEIDTLRTNVSEPEEMQFLYFLCVDLEALDSAEILASQLLRIQPENVALRRSFVDLLLKRKQHEKAWEQLHSIASSSSATAADFYFVARKCLNANNKSVYDLGCKAAQLAIDHGFEQRFMAKVTLVQSLTRAGVKTAAKKSVAELDTIAKNANEFAEIGELWMTLGDPANALLMARRGLAEEKLSHEHPLPRLRLADILTSCGEKAESRDLLGLIEWTRIKETTVLRRFYETCTRAQFESAALEAGKALLKLNPYDPRLKQEVMFLEISLRVAKGASLGGSASARKKQSFLSRIFTHRT